MQLVFPFRPDRAGRFPARSLLVVGRTPWSIEFVRHPRARHYVLRCLDPSTLRVTVPRGGSIAEAEGFVRARAAWLERERYRVSLAARPAAAWQDGTLVWFRGAQVPLDVGADGGGLVVRLADQQMRLKTPELAGIRPAVELHLWRLARRELPARLSEAAVRLGARVSSVTVRNQRSRWGSCSPTGGISLNWRLIQMPAEVADYILIHELTHLSVPNHSRRFWRAVERTCPDYRVARAWIRAHQRAIEGR